MARPARAVAHAQGQQRILLRAAQLRRRCPAFARLARRRRQPVVDHGVEAGVKRLLDQFARRVIRAGRLALAAVDKAKVRRPVRFDNQHRMLVEQAFIDAAQLFHIERGIVDAAAHLLVGGRKVRKLGDGLQQVAVVDVRRLQVQHPVGVKQFAVERRDRQPGGQRFIAQNFKQRAQPQVEVVKPLRAVERRIRQPPQPANAVMLGIEARARCAGVAVRGGQPQQVALLGSHQKDQPVDQIQKLLIKAVGAERVISGRLSSQRRHQLLVGAVGEKAVRQREDGRLHRLAQPVADAPALLDRRLVILLQQTAVAGIIAALVPAQAAGQPRAVRQPVEQDKLVQPFALDHRLQVKLDIGGAAEIDRIAQQTQQRAVGDNPPQVIAAVEIILDKGMRRSRAVAAWRSLAQLLVNGDDVNGRAALVPIARAVRDVKAAPVGAERLALVGEVVAQRLQQRKDPRLAGCRSQRFAVAGTGAAALERLPVGAHVAPHRRDLIDQRAAGVQPKISGLLPRRLMHRLQKIRREQPALHAYSQQ